MWGTLQRRGNGITEFTVVGLFNNPFAYWATRFSQREHKSLCWTPIILEQTLILVRLFLSFTENQLNHKQKV